MWNSEAVLGPVQITDMQTPFISGHIYMKDAKCAETNEKTIFLFLRFLVFEIWSFKFNQFADLKIPPKRCALCNALKRIF